MNRFLVIILPLVIMFLHACDTPATVKPRNESYFIKWYSGVREDNQYGADIIETLDGGLLIAGTSGEFNNPNSTTSEMLVIKTDAAGNEEWKWDASAVFAGGEKSEATSIVELPTGDFLVGGNYKSTGASPITRSVVIKISATTGQFTGMAADSVHVYTYDSLGEKSNYLSKITLARDGILIAGTTDAIVKQGGGINGFITLYDPDLQQGTYYPKYYFGLAGDDQVVGAFEIEDTVRNVGINGVRYLVFGSSDNGNLGGDMKSYYVGYGENFTVDPIITISGVIDGINKEGIGDFRLSSVARINDDFVAFGNVDQQDMYMITWRFAPASGLDWNPSLGTGPIQEDFPVLGKAVAVSAPDNYVIASDIQYTNDHQEVFIGRVEGDNRVRSPWPKIIGNLSSKYSANGIAVLKNGSVVTVGTADLEPIKKIVVIKTGPNGEMTLDE